VRPEPPPLWKSLIPIPAFGWGVKAPRIAFDELRARAATDEEMRGPFLGYQKRLRAWRVFYAIECVSFLFSLAMLGVAVFGSGTRRWVVPALILVSWSISLATGSLQRKNKRILQQDFQSDLLAMDRCPACGYDLGGVPAAGNGKAIICPECASVWETPATHGKGEPSNG
jgi:hypothetical protein